MRALKKLRDDGEDGVEIRPLSHLVLHGDYEGHEGENGVVPVDLESGDSLSSGIDKVGG